MSRSTSDLIAELAETAQPVGVWSVASRLATAVLFGVLASVTLQLLTVGVRKDVESSVAALGAKLISVAIVAGAWAWLLRKLVSPGSSDRLQRGLVVGVAAVAALIAAGGTPAGSGLARCVLQVFILAIPAFLVLAMSVRRCAPIDLVQAGIATGMLAGAIGVLGYSLGCTADDPTVVAWRYGIAIVIWGAIGGGLGKIVLRW